MTKGKINHGLQLQLALGSPECPFISPQKKENIWSKSETKIVCISDRKTFVIVYILPP